MLYWVIKFTWVQTAIQRSKEFHEQAFFEYRNVFAGKNVGSWTRHRFQMAI